MTQSLIIDQKLLHVIIKWFTQSVDVFETDSRVSERVFTREYTQIDFDYLERFAESGVISREFACKSAFSLSEVLWLRLLVAAEKRTLELNELSILVERVAVDTDTLNTLIQHVDLQAVFGVPLPNNVKQLLNTPDKLNDFIEKHAKSACLLDALLHFMITQRVSISLIIDQHANILPYTPMLFSEPTIDSRELACVLGSSHVSINLLELIDDLLTIDTQNELKLACLDTREQQLFGVLKDDQHALSQVAIRFGKDNTPTRMDVTRKMPVDTRARLNEIIAKNAYEDISVKTENGHVVHVENTQKIKLK